jgi:integrase/recombinase XerC
MVDSFFTYILYEKRYSKHTVVSYRNDLSCFQSYLLETYQISNLEDTDYNMVRSWIVTLVEDKLSARTINRKIASLRSFFKFLQKKGLIEKSPLQKIVAPKIKKSLPVFVEDKQMTELLDGFEFEDSFQGLRDQIVLELLYGTGIRLSELIELTERDVDKNTIKVLGKGNKERIIPMNKTLINNISIYRGEKENYMKGLNSEYFIVTDKGEKSYPVFIYRIVNKYLSEVTTVEKKSPHVLRHSFATHLLNKGADLNAIKELLGHSSLAATQVYTHNSLDKLKAIFDQAHPKS